MGKIILLIFTATLIFGDESLINKCNECHYKHSAPPYKKIYSQYLLVHSSKARVEKAMINFLSAPSLEKSLMPKGMKRRLDPNKHPVFEAGTTKEAVGYIIQREDIIKRF